VGRVESVGISPDDARMAEAVILLKSGTPIRKDSKVQVTSVGITGSMFLSISLGSPASPMVKPESVIRGQEAASFQDVINEAQGVASRVNNVLSGLDETAKLVFSDVKGLVQVARQKVTSILGTTDRAVARLENILSEKNEQNITKFLASLGGAATRLEKNIGPAIGEFQKTLGRVRGSIDTLDRTANSFTKLAGESSSFVGELKGRLATADRLMARFDRVGEGLEKVFATGEQAVGELTGALKAEIRIIREEVQKEIAASGGAVRSEISGVGSQAKSALKKGGDSLSDALGAVEGVANRVDGFLVTNQGDLRKVIVNFTKLSSSLNDILLQVGGEKGSKIKGAAEELRVAMGRARSLLSQLDDTVASHREDIQILITDLRDTASNLSNFTATIKDRPSSMILSAPAAPRTFNK
ncbi:MAG: MCE family protein, partial [Nitrospinaceae bacterium]|nr:MCE family protein [Nitrospinaceae bacterium]